MVAQIITTATDPQNNLSIWVKRQAEDIGVDPDAILTPHRTTAHYRNAPCALAHQLLTKPHCGCPMRHRCGARPSGAQRRLTGWRSRVPQRWDYRAAAGNVSPMMPNTKRICLRPPNKRNACPGQPVGAPASLAVLNGMSRSLRIIVQICAAGVIRRKDRKDQGCQPSITPRNPSIMADCGRTSTSLVCKKPIATSDFMK